MAGGLSMTCGKLAVSVAAALLSIATAVAQPTNPSPTETQSPVRTPAPLKAACGPDLQQFCTGITPGQGRLISCLREHRVQLSTGCRTYLRELRQKNAEKRKQNKEAAPKEEEQQQ